MTEALGDLLSQRIQPLTLQGTRNRLGADKYWIQSRRMQEPTAGDPPNARRAPVSGPVGGSDALVAYCTAFTMSKIGRYMATTMPPTITPRTTIMIGSMRESSVPTAASTSSS